MVTVFVSFREGTLCTLVLRVWASRAAYSHVVHREPVLGRRSETPSETAVCVNDDGRDHALTLESLPPARAWVVCVKPLSEPPEDGTPLPKGRSTRPPHP